MPKTHDYMFLLIPKGTVFTIMNPKWKIGDEESQTFITIILEEDAGCHLTGGNYEYSIIEKEIKE